jgi:hypothetical protein
MNVSRFLGDTMLVSVHIPKCGGTSFRHVLQALFGERLFLNYGAIFTRAQARVGLLPPNPACIHGHFFADAFDDLFPERQLITWVRHPVERVVSNYYHFLRSPDLRDDCCRALVEDRLTLREFAELDWMRNEGTRYLVGKPIGDFCFVGVAERFLESLRVFSETFAIDLPPAAPRENLNPARAASRYPLSDEDYGHILALNALDLAWYDQAVRRLDIASEACAALAN